MRAAATSLGLLGGPAATSLGLLRRALHPRRGSLGLRLQAGLLPAQRAHARQSRVAHVNAAAVCARKLPLSSHEAAAAAASVTERAQAQIEAERSQAMASLRRDVSELALTLAGKVVGESLTDDARARASVDRFIADLEVEAAK